MAKKRKLPKLRTCASCEWVFDMDSNDPTCPRCTFGSYGAYSVYGKNAYKYRITQQPWIDKKVAALRFEAYKARPVKKNKPQLYALKLKGIAYD